MRSYAAPSRCLGLRLALCLFFCWTTLSEAAGRRRATKTYTERDVKRLKDQVAELKEQLAQGKSSAEGTVDVAKKYNKLVEKHNDLIQERNMLLKEHKKVVGQYNQLVDKYNGLLSKAKDPTVSNFLAESAAVVLHHPGISGAANKTYTHVLPVATRAQASTMEWFNRTSDRVEDLLESMTGDTIGDNWLPLASGFLVYGSVIFPIVFAFNCVAGYLCQARKLLLLIHMYLACVATMAGGFAVWSNEDPLSAFYKHDPALYLFGQIVFALILAMYMVLSFYQLSAEEDGQTAFRVVQVGVALIFIVAYYQLIWTPAMIDLPPAVETVAAHLPLPRAASLPYWLSTIAFGASYVLEEDADRRLTDPVKEDKPE
eukprot:TRINITY_DN18076_c0_g1_i1.p1 TRINITY_DN18076_c0_g1~~TRINITY_DN18076_c0_g1_i1.p1  ORF type:complete len:372 (-),score=84.52 TRINITY_DN18076_c0_g1_i1:123-1238(-)